MLKSLNVKRQWTGHAFSIWLCASFDESDGVLDELPAGLHELHDLIHPEVMLKTGQSINITSSEDITITSTSHINKICYETFTTYELI